jgi:hypothetical protein
MVVVGFLDSPKVAVLSGADLAFQYVPSAGRMDDGSLGTAEWSSDGRKLYAGGRYVKGDADSSPLVVWGDSGRGTRTAWPASMSTLMDLRALPNGQVAFAAADPSWGVFDSNGKFLVRHAPPSPEHRNKHRHLRLSEDAGIVEMAFDTQTAKGWLRRTARFDLPALDVRMVGKPSQQLTAARTEGLPIEGWRKFPRLAGTPIELKPGEESNCLAIAPSNSRFLLGTSYSLRMLDTERKELWRQAAPSHTWAANVSRDGRWAVAAFGDGTVRWYTLADGKERLALFVHADGQRWVAFTPEGFFAASKGGETLVGYHLNQGPTQSGEFIRVDQLHDLFYRPDLVARSLDSDWEQRSAKALAAIGDVRRVLAQGLPPKVEILPGHKIAADGQLELGVRITNRGGGVGRLVFAINGVQLEGRPEVPGIPGQGELTVKLPLPEGKGVAVSVAGYNERGQIQSRPAELKVDVALQRSPITLHVLAAGVTQYRDKKLQLKYARKDAEALVKEFARRGRGLFARVNVHPPLLDQEVTIPKLEAAFDRLSGMVKPNDVFVFYAAGHGTVRDGRYLFLPANLVYTNDEAMRAGGLNELKLRELLAKIPAQKSLVLLDTCASGVFASGTLLASRARSGLEEKAALDRLMKATGRAVLAASSDDKMALEGYRGHGVFTAAVIDGLAKGDRNNNGMVDVNELGDFVVEEVPRITKQLWQYEQFPQRSLELKGPAFDLARVK